MRMREKSDIISGTRKLYKYNPSSFRCGISKERFARMLIFICTAINQMFAGISYLLVYIFLNCLASQAIWHWAEDISHNTCRGKKSVFHRHSKLISHPWVGKNVGLSKLSFFGCLCSYRKILKRPRLDFRFLQASKQEYFKLPNNTLLWNTHPEADFITKYSLSIF